jgi:hypothetical protein
MISDGEDHAGAPDPAAKTSRNENHNHWRWYWGKHNSFASKWGHRKKFQETTNNRVRFITRCFKEGIIFHCKRNHKRRICKLGNNTKGSCWLHACAQQYQNRVRIIVIFNPISMVFWVLLCFWMFSFWKERQNGCESWIYLTRKIAPQPRRGVRII